MLTSYSNVVQGGDGVVTGMGAPSNGSVLTGVVGNEKLKFSGASKRSDDAEEMVVKRWAEKVTSKRRKRQDVVVEESGVAMLACDRMACN